MGKKSKNKGAQAAGSEPTVEAGAEGHQEKQEIVKRLAAAAKLDAANLGMESAEEVRARLAKSQTIAREIMGLLRLERERTLILEHLLEQNNIAVPARPEPKVEGDAASNPAS
mmetsp:Transcript_47699/g.91130  ORF Transcript_47699/g.91130 Transcript_47699/m.91130 type:complete len:113 (+) Transcript_47699:198-536(+)|eukprot:CAMPEP_0114244702 /NCGR_PEP_ID=MMETSP0058-20121206/11487_1 /TAXON_ID=36894 /ORGANISM="Pyramimonas parkeae, CCMP726" /LENGTH=112 /DNA_ID=CAMNT_0001357673 /DNA_START=191 /DNA_END=529 /DNA_ORIENTATION=+